MFDRYYSIQSDYIPGKAMSEDSGIDWTQIKIESPTDRQLRPQVGKLNRLDYIKLMVMSYVDNESISSTLKSAVSIFIESNWESHLAKLQIEANRLDVSVEELITRIANGETIE